MRALEWIDFKHPVDQSGPTRSRPDRFGLRGRSCLIDKPPVDLHFVARRLLGADASATIRVPAEKSDEMFSLVWNVLREFREEIEQVENLKVAAGAASQITAGRRSEAPAVALLRTIYDRTRIKMAKIRNPTKIRALESISLFILFLSKYIL